MAQTSPSKLHYSERPSLFPIEGGCPCGLVRYRLEAPPLIVHCCHCTSCQRESGAAFAVNALVEATNVTRLPPAAAAAAAPTSPASPAGSLPELNTTRMPSASGVGTYIHRCPACGVGAWGWHNHGGPALAFVRLGTLDRPWEVEPDVHVYTRSRRAFFDIADGKPQYEAFYAGGFAAVFRPDSLERLERIKPEMKRHIEGRVKREKEEKAAAAAVAASRL